VSPSGLGKTTIVRLLSGLLHPSAGRISINGRTPAQAVRERRIGLVSQGPANLLPHLNLFANVALPVAVASERLSVSRLTFVQKRDVARSMRTARILHAARLRPHECSGGMIARALLARALVPRPHFPDLLILDEAFSQLDELTAESLYSDLQTIANDLGMMVVVISHHLNEVCLLCDGVYPLIRATASEPSKIGSLVSIDLPRPRTSDVYVLPAFAHARSALRASLTEGLA
jgi:NitT/TauT family transport system ATP-binding protein